MGAEQGSTFRAFNPTKSESLIKELSRSVLPARVLRAGRSRVHSSTAICDSSILGIHGAVHPGIPWTSYGIGNPVLIKKNRAVFCAEAHLFLVVELYIENRKSRTYGRNKLTPTSKALEGACCRFEGFATWRSQLTVQVDQWVQTPVTIIRS